MSLLEDVFLEDEAGEAQELERVIEGDGYDTPRAVTPNSDGNSEKEDEAEEDRRRVDPAQSKPKKVVKNPRFILNPARLTGPRGISVIPDHFKDFMFKGKGHEKEDLDLVLKKLEHWAYRLYPKFGFEDCLKKIEILGKKRPVMVHLQKIRSDQFMSEEIVHQKDSSDDDETPQPVEDEFDKLLQQQIELARSTPGPGFVQNIHSPPRTISMPKATSSPSISDEQRERMLRNRKLAEERRLAKLAKANEDSSVFSAQQISANEEQNVETKLKENENNTDKTDAVNTIDTNTSNDRTESNQIEEIHDGNNEDEYEECNASKDTFSNFKEEEINSFKKADQNETNLPTDLSENAEIVEGIKNNNADEKNGIDLQTDITDNSKDEDIVNENETRSEQTLGVKNNDLPKINGEIVNEIEDKNSKEVEEVMDIDFSDDF